MQLSCYKSYPYEIFHVEIIKLMFRAKYKTILIVKNVLTEINFTLIYLSHSNII